MLFFKYILKHVLFSKNVQKFVLFTAVSHVASRELKMESNFLIASLLGFISPNLSVMKIYDLLVFVSCVLFFYIYICVSSGYLVNKLVQISFYICFCTSLVLY